jgi:hypothetical protein
MVIIKVDNTQLPAGVKWPGDFILAADGANQPALYHIPDWPAFAAYEAAGLPVRTLTYAQFAAIGGKS